MVLARVNSRRFASCSSSTSKELILAVDDVSERTQILEMYVIRFQGLMGKATRSIRVYLSPWAIQQWFQIRKLFSRRGYKNGGKRDRALINKGPMTNQRP